MPSPDSTPEERFAALVAAFSSAPDVTLPAAAPRRHGFGSGELKVQGKIFALLSGGRLVVKLSRARVDALVAIGAGTRFDPRHDGRLMKEWIVLSSPDEAEWRARAQEAQAFVAGRPVYQNDN